jgi:hypothetical protein
MTMRTVSPPLARRIGRFLARCAPAVCIVAHLAAQEVRGTVLLPDSSRAEGVIVEATDGHGIVAARALTGPRGGFDLRLPAPGRYVLRILRIGFKPTVVPPVGLESAEVRTLSIVLVADPVTIAAVTVRGRSVCHMRQDSAQTVTHLWEEARKAIIATQLSAAGPQLFVRATVYDRQTDLTGTQLLTQHNSDMSGPTLKPFASLPPDSLAKVGYMGNVSDGAVYRAPDAEALLSDAFALLHCFRVEPPTAAHSEWIGIAFRPARERGNVVDIEGTLWLDRASSELRLLEFMYTNLPKDVADAEAGGTIEFLRLSTGSWLINRWVIRMPRTSMKLVQKYTGGLRPEDVYQPSLDGLQFTGGEVTAVEQHGVTIFSVGASARDYMPALLADDAKLAASCQTDSTNGDLPAVLRGTVSDGGHNPIPGAAVSITWRTQFRPTGKYEASFKNEQRDFMTSATGEWFVCDIPRERVLTIRATAGGRASTPLTVRIPRERASAGVTITIAPDFR